MRASSSATPGAPSPAPCTTGPGGSSWPTAGRSSSTRGARSPPSSRRSCSRCSRRGSWSVGEERTRRVDVRLIAATNRDLRAEAEAGRFRQDLYFRLSVFPIELTPLRRRAEDIPVLAEHFLALAARKLGRPKPRLTLADAQRLQRYPWPGTARELQHAIERARTIADGSRPVLELPADPAAPRPEARPSPTPDNDG